MTDMNEQIDEIHEQMDALATRCGMTPYWERLKDEIEFSRRRNGDARQEPMAYRLLVPPLLSFRVVNCRSGRERRYVHQWAEGLELDHRAVKTTLFDPVYIFDCKECRQKSYDDELIKGGDYSTTTGAMLGTVVKCPCLESFVTFDSLGSSGVDLRRSTCFNAVIVGRDLSRLDQFPGRKTKVGKSKSRTRNRHFDPTLRMVERPVIEIDTLEKLFG
jgi:hypothetical protein